MENLFSDFIEMLLSDSSDISELIKDNFILPYYLLMVIMGYLLTNFKINIFDIIRIFKPEFNKFLPTGTNYAIFAFIFSIVYRFVIDGQHEMFSYFLTFFIVLGSYDWVLKYIPILNQIFNSDKKVLNSTTLPDYLIEGCTQGQTDSIAGRNNNPFNIKDKAFMHKYVKGQDKHGHAIFTCIEAGFVAGIIKLMRVYEGLSEIYSADMTLEQFFDIYSANPNDDELIGHLLGVPNTTLIKNINVWDLAEALSRSEDVNVFKEIKHFFNYYREISN